MNIIGLLLAGVARVASARLKRIGKAARSATAVALCLTLTTSLDPIMAGPGPQLAAKASARGAPAGSWSHYLRTASPGRLETLGCRDGARVRRRGPKDGIAVLAFGRPVRWRGTFGASLWGRFASTDAIRAAGQGYARGFHRCSGGSGSLTVALGTSNHGSQVTHRHGRAWAKMVNKANEWLQAHGLAPTIRAAGAIDIETAWNGPRVSRRWVGGYDSAARWPFYNYGDAGGCPPAGRCHRGWTYEDLWYVSWGAKSAWPLPQIYTATGTMSEQWYRISLYAHRKHGRRLSFAGVMTQHRACRRSSDPLCRFMDNHPDRGWRQLSRMLNGDPRTAQRLRWVTDIGWFGGR